MPAPRFSGFTVMVRVAGVKVSLLLAANQLAPEAVATVSPKLTEGPVRLTVWTVGLTGGLKVSEDGEAASESWVLTPSVTGTLKGANPAAVTVMVAVYVPGWLSSEFSVLISIPTWNVRPFTGGWGNSAAGVFVPGVTVTAITGVLASLAVTVTNTGCGAGSFELYSKSTALGLADKTGAVPGVAAGAAATKNKQSFRARDSRSFI